MGLGKPTWFRMDPGAFLSDGQVDAMSTLELGACFRLLCRQWLDGYIPDDQHVLARLCRLDADSMAQAWQTLSRFFPVVESGKRANRFMWIEREKVIVDLERKSDEGRRAAHKLWTAKRLRNASLNTKPNASPNGSPMPDPMQEKSRVERSRAENTFPQTQFADDRAPVPDNNRSSPTEDQLEQLYKLYPRKRDKLEAKKAIRKAVGVVIAGDPDHPAMLLEEALNYLAQRMTLYVRCVQGCDRNYIPYPASWFNAGSFWDDERDWPSKPKFKGNGAAGAALPPSYVPASERIRQERTALPGGAQ
jgi:uncharacterized protein YdaU (DUF1376 family)